MKKPDQSRTERMYALVGRWQKSGLSKKAFSQKEGITYESFRYWVKKHSKESSITREGYNTPGFVPLQVKPSMDIIPSNIEITYPNGIKVNCPSTIGLGPLKMLIRLF